MLGEARLHCPGLSLPLYRVGGVCTNILATAKAPRPPVVATTGVNGSAEEEEVRRQLAPFAYSNSLLPSCELLFSCRSEARG